MVFASQKPRARLEECALARERVGNSFLRRIAPILMLLTACRSPLLAGMRSHKNFQGQTGSKAPVCMLFDYV